MSLKDPIQRAEYARSWRETNRESLTAKKRAYYEEHRAEILANRPRIAEQRKAWHAANLEKSVGRRKDYMRKHRYGIDPEQHARLIVEQDDRCFLCKKAAKLCVDHDHETGNVRKLLCSPCNTRLGVLEKIIARGQLDCFLAYIETFK